MLKPKDTWNWFFDKQKGALMLDLGEMLFKVNLPKKVLVECAYNSSEFTVDDASAFHVFKEQISNLNLSEAKQAELALNCVAAKRFHKPVQPKSWFFDPQGEGYLPTEGDIVHLKNSYGRGLFIVIEVCETASLCTFIEQREFILDGVKTLQFGELIKVMHNRMICSNELFVERSIALVS